MASSKFNRRPVPRRRPPICRPPPKEPYDPVPEEKPRQLAGFARWTDLDPAIEHPPDTHGYLALQKIDELPTYRGQTLPNTYHLVATVQLKTPPDVFLVKLDLYHDNYLEESHSWPAVQVHFPFDTGLLTDVVIPNQDYRLARFME